MRLQFVLTEVLRGLRRNLSMVISVVLVTFVSLGFMGAAALIQMQVNKLQTDWYDLVEVSVFLCPTGSRARRAPRARPPTTRSRRSRTSSTPSCRTR